jgi:AcrR family transcriptional regulator
MANTETAHVRRTQEERSAETRAKLMDATIASLVEVGYAGTTTTGVAERAGVSRGAQTHHFPVRTELVVAAVGRLGERLFTELGRRAAALPTGRERIPAALDMIWQEFTSPTYKAVVELWVAAAHDPELHDRLADAEERWSKASREFARQMLGEHFANHVDAVTTSLSAIRGLALMRAYEPTKRPRRADPWPAHRRSLERLFRD